MTKEGPNGAQGSSSPRATGAERWIRVALVLALLVVISISALLDFLPPVEKDTLVYHLSIPKIWLRAGKLIEIPWIENSYFPANLQTLYLLPLAAGWDVGAKFIHHAFGLLTALILGLHIRSRLSLNWGLLGALIFLSTPMMVRLAASAYVDLGLTFFITSAVLALIRWEDSGRMKFFVLSAIALGLGMGTKYNGLLAVPFLSLGLFWLRFRKGDAFLKSGAWTATYLALALAFFSPWLIRNFMLTGNPMFPLLNDFWGGRILPFKEWVDGPAFLFRDYLYGEPFWMTLIAPIRFFFQGRDFSAQFFDGVLNPFLVLLPPLALIRPKTWELRPLAIMAVAWLFLIPMNWPHVLVRFAAPAVALLSILSVFGLHAVRTWVGQHASRWADVGPVLITVVIVVFNAGPIHNFWQAREPWPFLMGRETRDEYLERQLGFYPAMVYINQHTPLDARVLFLLSGDRGYYLERDWRQGSLFSSAVMAMIMEKARSGDDILRSFREMGLTHILTVPEVLRDYLLNNYPREKLMIWQDFLNKGWRLVFEKNGFAVFELAPEPGRAE